MMYTCRLGWTGECWDGDTDASLQPFQREFSLMSAHDKRCVHVLGFPPEDFRVDRASDGRLGADKTWNEMSPDEQQCAQLLGWDDVKWHRRDRVPQTKPWAELSLDEQNAEVFLVRPRHCFTLLCPFSLSSRHTHPHTNLI